MGVFVKSNRETTKIKKEKDNNTIQPIVIEQPVKNKNVVPLLEKSKNEKKSSPEITTTMEDVTKIKKDISLKQLISSSDNTHHHLSRKIPKKSSPETTTTRRMEDVTSSSITKKDISLKHNKSSLDNTNTHHLSRKISKKSKNHPKINSEKKSITDNTTLMPKDTTTTLLLKSNIPVSTTATTNSSLKLETTSTKAKTNLTNKNNELPRNEEKEKGSSTIDKKGLPPPSSIKNTTKEVLNNAHPITNTNIVLNKTITSSSPSMNTS